MGGSAPGAALRGVPPVSSDLLPLPPPWRLISFTSQVVELQALRRSGAQGKGRERMTAISFSHAVELIPAIDGGDGEQSAGEESEVIDRKSSPLSPTRPCIYQHVMTGLVSPFFCMDTLAPPPYRC